MVSHGVVSTHVVWRSGANLTKLAVETHAGIGIVGSNYLAVYPAIKRHHV